MRNLLPGLLLVLTAAPAFGGERKPNTLTAQEIRGGWILLFDGETGFGWKNERQAFGPKFTLPLGWKVIDGILRIVDDDGVSKGDNGIMNTSKFGNFELSFQYRVEGKAPMGYARCWLTQSVDSLGYSCALGPNGKEWKHFAIKSTDKKLFFFLDKSDKGLAAHDGATKPPFDLGFSSFFSKSLGLRNIKLRPLNLTPLFNGKDLIGWKPFAGKKSKFEVKEGAITITDGPGDLQTVGKYRDFILQLECKSNGKHLNSGVFFRCRDGEYQNGYEAQIRNQFTAEPKQVYTIEDYDPKTHELIGKKKVKYTAVDYGTGAIYRRQPARREVARDGEWFTMTILAHGNHFATWVNGIQVTDWTDNRPPSDNARTGFRREAGHISFQGHDPTTKLSFRNIRIAELK